MPKALARNEMMTRGNIETVVDNVSVVDSKASNQQMDNAQVVVMVVDQERNLISSPHHVIQVVPEGEAVAVQVELTR